MTKRRIIITAAEIEIRGDFDIEIVDEAPVLDPPPPANGNGQRAVSELEDE